MLFRPLPGHNLAKLQIARPKGISEDKLEELRRYVLERWQQAERSRSEQVDGDYQTWDKAYNGVPLEGIRTVPFYKSSNFVVKLIRMYLDTFVARSLNIIYATKPLLVCDNLPRELKEAYELYLNAKTVYEWKFYNLTKDLCFRGNKNGTVVTKTMQVENTSIAVEATPEGEAKKVDIIDYTGPTTKSIPFEDFYIYPITANSLEEAIIKFHRVRYPRETAQQLIDKGTWTVKDDATADTYAKRPRDAKKASQQSDAGIVDTYYKEVKVVECHLKYAITNDETELYDIICVLEPDSGELFDLYFNPYPRNLCTFSDYRPFPREDLFYGESMCQLLGQAQEEASVIHNDRRNNSFISNSVVFKRKSGSNIPNPSTNWYPGKVFDLDDMDDLDVINIGRNYDDMLGQENFTFTLAEKLSGISDVMQGAGAGAQQKGVYNTMGTIATMQEGNQRQDTNLRDVRQSLSCIASLHSTLQAHYVGKDDPYLDTLEDSVKAQVIAALDYMVSKQGKLVWHEIKSSSAGVNKEVERSNLLQIAGILSQYGQMAQQMAMQLSNPQLNPSLRLVMNDVIVMQKWMATRLMREFDEFDAAEIIPDVAAAIERTVPGGGRGTKEEIPDTGQGDMASGGPQGALPPVSRAQLDTISSLPTLPGGSPNGGGMATKQ